MTASRVSAVGYLHIDTPHGLVLTWLWEHNMDALQLPVSVELTEANGGTDMKLLHERLPGETARDLHSEAWTGCLDVCSGWLNNEVIHCVL